MSGDNEFENNVGRDSLEAEAKSVFTRSLAVIIAFGFTILLLIGYTFLRWQHAKRLRAEQESKQLSAQPTPAPSLQVFIDDATLKGSQAIISGTVQNISTQTFSGINVEIELKRRKDGSTEMRTLALEPSSLGPDERGRYQLSVPSGEYRDARLKRIRKGTDSAEIAFKTAPGAQRSPERTPTTTKTIIIKPTPNRINGEEFINTPDTPVTVP